MISARRLVAPSIATAALIGLVGCTGAPPADGRPQVLASFYPLEYVVTQVAGDLVEVSSMTPPGAEPHDLELSPRQVREVGQAQLVVYLSGFQPAVDDAVAARAPENVVDAARTPAVAEHMAQAAEAGTTGPDAHDHDAIDPHFWLDPTLLAAVATDVADALAEVDPDNAGAYAAGAEDLIADLTALDGELADGLARCERSVVVTAHAAFGYLTERYGLEQVPISGLDPEAEPSPARLRDIRDVVESEGVTTVFTEVLVSPQVAQTLADDLGITTAVLDPVESQADPQVDYRGAMEQNLEALRSALGCA